MASIILLGTVLSTCLVTVLSHGIVSVYPASGSQQAWYDPNNTMKIPTCKIPYRYNVGTFGGNLQDKTTLETAMRLVEKELGNAIQFTQTMPVGYTGPFINFKRQTGTTPNLSCAFLYGYYPYAGESQGQDTVVFGGSPGGCLDNQRDTMRILVNLLGLRNEWQHTNRANNMIIPTDYNSRVTASLTSLNLLSTTYNPTTVADLFAVQGQPPVFDTQSITMIDPSRFAANLNNPVFSMAPGLPAIGTLPKLSKTDCETLLYLYQHCTPTVADFQCTNPYDQVQSVASFYPTNVIKHNLQCQSQIPMGQRVNLGELLLDGVKFPDTPPLTGVQLLGGPTNIVPQLTKRDGIPVKPDANGNLVDCTNLAAGPCQYGVKFLLTNLGTLGGLTDQQVTVNFMAGTTVAYTLTVSITLNCAPIFRTLSANVGPLPQLAAEKVYKFGAEIVSVPIVPFKDSSMLRAANAGVLAQYTVNYNIPNAVGTNAKKGVDPGAGDKQADADQKVFVNCIKVDDGSSVDKGDRMAGMSVIATVMASDPEFESVSYFAYSGDFRSLEALANGDAGKGTALKGGAEMHTVTKDGVVAIAGMADPSEASGVVNPANPGNGDPNNPNGGLVSAGKMIGSVGGASKSKAGAVDTATKDVFIVAVDARGASSVLQARFNLACGQLI